MKHEIEVKEDIFEEIPEELVKLEQDTYDTVDNADVAVPMKYEIGVKEEMFEEIPEEFVKLEQNTYDENNGIAKEEMFNVKTEQ